MLMKTRLRNYEYPDLKLIERIPLLLTGKVDRQRLLKSYEDERNNTGLQNFRFAN